jgi:uridine phosphorylase
MIQSSELILNPDGSVYHLNLKPENIAHDIISFVGDQNRVEKNYSVLIVLNFDSKREFKTQTGSKGKHYRDVYWNWSR